MPYTYQGFRKANPGLSRQELSAAWKAYKERNEVEGEPEVEEGEKELENESYAPYKKSPSKSPRKSPVRKVWSPEDGFGAFGVVDTSQKSPRKSPSKSPAKKKSPKGNKSPIRELTGLVGSVSLEKSHKNTITDAVNNKKEQYPNWPGSVVDFQPFGADLNFPVGLITYQGNKRIISPAEFTVADSKRLEADLLEIVYGLFGESAGLVRFKYSESRITFGLRFYHDVMEDHKEQVKKFLTAVQKIDVLLSRNRKLGVYIRYT